MADALTAKQVPPALRLQSLSGLLHVRSPHTRHWATAGTPMCNDSMQLPVRRDITRGLVCKRCSAAYRKEIAS